MDQLLPGVQLPSESRPDSADPKLRLRRLETLLVLAPLPLAMVHLFGLWSNDAYRFFPLLLVTIVYLLRRRISKYGVAPDEQRTRLARFMIAVGLLLVASSVLLASPWLATAAMICMLGGVFSRVVGETFRKHVLPIWWLLWFFLPPPFGFDRWFVHFFDEGVRKAADGILDLHGYVHWLAGDVLRTTDGSFVLNFDFTRFVTPLAVMAFAAALAVWRRRSFLQAIILVLSAVLWLGLSEVLGIAAVPVLYRAWAIDLTSFWLSLAANGAILVLTVLLIHSTDVLFKPMAATAATLKTAVSRFAKKLPRRLRPKKKRTHRTKSSRGTGGAAAPALQSDLGSANRPEQQTASRSIRRSRRSRRSRPLPMIVARMAGTACVASICLQLGLIFHGLNMASGRADATKRMAEAIATAPRELGTWERVADSAKDGSQAASEARHWRFASADSNIEATLLPISGEIQEISTGHNRQGWNVYHRTTYPARSWRHELRMPQTEIDIDNSAGEAAWFVYGAIDSRGTPWSATRAAIRATWSQTPASWLLKGLGIRPPEADLLYGLQFLVTSEEPLSARERESVRKAFRQLIEIVRTGQSKG